MARGITIRPSQAGDIHFLWDMLYEAAAVNPGIRAMGKEAAFTLAAVRKYLEGWGRAGDTAVVAENGRGERLGAAWYRLFPEDAPGYGFVAAGVPELSIGVIEEARGRGVGGKLLDALMQAAREESYSRLSLSVDRENPALALYQRHGFRDAGISGPEETSVTMVADL